MSTSFNRLIGIVFLGTVFGASAHADWSVCFDPLNMQPISVGAGWEYMADDLFASVMGVTGTVTYGGATNETPPAPCFTPAVTADFAGRIGFGIGSTGSAQSPFSANMALTFGFPYPAGSWSYATLVADGTRTLFGSTGFVTAFFGASDRYYFAEEVIGLTTVDLRMDVIGDTARAQWTLTNNDTAASHTLGLWYGAWTAMITQSGDASGFGAENSAAGATSDKPQFVIVPGIIPPTTEHRFIRSQDPANFPAYVDFCFGQTNAYGLRTENGPTPDTEDSSGLNSDATLADEFALGQAFFLLGGLRGGNQTFPDVMFGPGNTGGDVTYVDQPAFIQKYYDTQVPSGANRMIIEYFRTTWAVSNYFKPYSVVVDAPQVIGTDFTTSTDLAQNPLNPDGSYTIRVYVDDTRGFSQADQSEELDQVNITLKLPSGVNLASGETSTKVIPKVLPANPVLDHVDFHVIPDGIAFGQLPYTVTVAPGNAPAKTLGGNITVAATPKLTLGMGPNLVGTPWTFVDSSWEAVLGLVAGSDFTAYNFDPIQNGYVISTSAVRGVGSWLVANQPFGIRTLQSSPKEPSDQTTGAPLIQLQQGWNLVANPYDYAITLGQLIGSTNANSQTNFTWAQLVSQGFVNGAVAYFTPSTGSYSYIQASTDLIQPNSGYWIYVAVSDPLTVKFPPVNMEFVPGSMRSAAAPPYWTQTDNKWRLQLAVREGSTIDDKNYIGIVPTTKDVTAQEIVKPPVMPAKVQGVSMAITGVVNNKPTRMAQALSTPTSKQQYKVNVTTPQAGNVTLTWPNLSTIPKTVQVRLVDTATGASRSMNQTSGYTFTAQAGATRTFLVQVQPQTRARASLGNIIVTRTTKSKGSPVAITYTLGAAATTSIQINNRAGVAIYNAVSGRSDTVGSNSVLWNLRDNANRNVAPGIYTVVITVTTNDGSVERRTATVNVIR